MWQKDESHKAAVKIINISIVSYIQYKEMWVSGLSQVINIKFLHTHKSELINIGSGKYRKH
jgi:hypothetical protein